MHAQQGGQARNRHGRGGFVIDSKIRPEPDAAMVSSPMPIANSKLSKVSSRKE
jgi:hypothetical protein